MATSSPFFAFAGHELIGRGDATDVVAACLERVRAGDNRRIIVFEERTGRPIDLDFSRDVSTLVANVDPAGPGTADPPPKRTGPGRPRLGVVSREVSLLPRHWEWLAEQRGGASAALRRLVDQARKDSGPATELRRIVDAAHRFLWDLAGDLPDFEEGTRSLYAGDFDDLAKKSQSWPAGVREQLARYLERARAAQARVAESRVAAPGANAQATPDASDNRGDGSGEKKNACDR